ncbi:zinc-ribbon domain-containing protein [Myxococcus stipitatus]|uniref:zinc-ribbon domain-containing protein n=1 Tax=Myxococcus stipitatus TaxID=83455 RepID=UPI003144F74D
MIVKCARCQTRFKIPDEKVTEKGVKVRCTKCQNTFRVTRESAGEDAGVPLPPPSGGQVDPFAGFGVAPDPQGVEVTRPGFYAQGVAATRTSVPDSPWNSVDGGLDTEDGVYREPTRVGPIPLPPPQAPGAAEAARGSAGLSGGAVPLPGLAPPVRSPSPGVAAPRGTGAQGRPPPPPTAAPQQGRGTASAGRGGVPPSGGAAGSAVDDPFMDFLNAPVPGGASTPFDDLPAPVAAPGSAARRPTTVPSGADPFASIDIDDATVTGRPPFASAPPVPTSAEEDPFASIDIDDSAMSGGADPFGSTGGDDATFAGAPPFMASGASPTGAQGAAAARPAGAPGVVSGRPPQGAPPGVAQMRAPQAVPPTRAPLAGGPSAPQPGGATPPRPPPPPAAPSGDDLFAALGPAPSQGRAAAPAGEDPFASIGGTPPQGRGTGGATPPRPPPQAAAPSGDLFASLDDATIPGRPLASGRAVEAPFPSLEDATLPGRPPHAAASGKADPFASLGSSPSQGRPPGGAAPSAGGAAPQGRAPRPEAAVAGGAAPQGRVPRPAAPGGEDLIASLTGTPAPAAPGGEDPFASLDLGDATMPGRPPSSAPASSPGDLFDLSSDSDAFGEHAGVQPSESGRAELFGHSSPDGLALDEHPGHSTRSLLDDVPPVDEGQGLGVSLGRIGVPGSAQREVVDLSPDVSAAPAVSVVKPTARPEDVGIPQSRPPSRARKVTALLLNLVVAAALVVGLGAVGRVYLREGRIDLTVLSPERLRALVVPAPTSLVALDVSNGLYETQSGRPVFFIRGDIENRTSAATKVRVRGALFDGAQRVRSAEGLAGTVATPEELHAVGNAESALALRQRLDGAATSVAPGARVPFLLVFHEYPADLGAFRLEVTMEAVAEPSAPAPVPTPSEAPAQAAPTE